MVSKGAAALAVICKDADRGQTSVAERLDEHQSLVSRWVAGERIPSAQSRKKIEDVFGIDWRSWDDPAEDAPPDTERASA